MIVPAKKLLVVSSLLSSPTSVQNQNLFLSLRSPVMLFLKRRIDFDTIKAKWAGVVVIVIGDVYPLQYLI